MAAAAAVPKAMGEFLLTMRQNRFLFWAAVMIPAGVTFYLISRYAVLVPYQDEWSILRFIRKDAAGTLRLFDFWIPHNEHRLFFPQIILFLFAKITRWNLRYEILLNFLAAFSVWAIYFRFVRKEREHLHPGLRIWLPLGASILTFSLAQWRNWLWGFQFQMFFCTATTMAGLWWAAYCGERKIYFSLALLAGIVTAYSFSSGLVYWPAAFLILCLRPGAFRQRKTQLIVWLAAALAVVTVWLWGYEKPPQNPSWLTFLETPFEFFRHIFIFLGSVFVTKDMPRAADWAFGAGLTGFLFQSALLIFLIRKKRSQAVLFPAGLFFWVFGSAVTVALGRCGFGSGQALASRYTTHSYPFWISALFLCALSLNGEALKTKRQKAGAGFLICVFSAILIFSSYASYRGIGKLKKMHADVEYAVSSFEETGDPAAVKILFPWSAEKAARRVSEIKDRKLALYAV